MSSSKNSQNRITRSSGSLLYCITLAFIGATIFLLPSSMKSLASVVFAGTAFILLCCQKPSRIARVRYPKALLGAFGVIVLVILVSLALSPYSKSTLFISTAFLVLTISLFYDDGASISPNLTIEKIFYVVVSLVVLFEVVSNIGVPWATYVHEAYDKNYFGIILYLFFCWCWATGRKIGIALALGAAAVIGSRNYIIMLCLFAVLTIMSNRSRRRAAAGSQNPFLKPRTIFCVFLTMFLGTLAFSFWWSGNMVGTGTAAYGASMNDSSNAVRFNSNVYAVIHAASNPELLLYGYDDDIIDAMDIIQSSELDGTESELDGTFYNGYRIVQPHNVFLNLILREGVLYTLGYFVCLSIVFSRYFRRDNAAYWLPYLFGCLFMHSLLSSYYLLFFVLILKRSDFSRSLKSVSSPVRSRGMRRRPVFASAFNSGGNCR